MQYVFYEVVSIHYIMASDLAVWMAAIVAKESNGFKQGGKFGMFGWKEIQATLES